MQATELRPGTIIKHNKGLYAIHKAEHRTPGNKRGFVQARMRNLDSGAMIDHRFRSEDEVERAIIDEVEMQYLYSDGDLLYLMNTQSYEQVHMHREVIGDRALYLAPDIMIRVEFFEGRPIDILLPPTVALKVVVNPPVEQIVWYVDGSPFQTADFPYTARLPLEPGEHTIQARVPYTDTTSSPVRIAVQ